MKMPFSTKKNSEVISLITQEIQEAGAISFARFMELALYAPKVGYYTGSSPKLGKSGDFVTAPEISPLFAKCAAKQCRQILSQIQNNSILELGAGSGIFAKELLLELEKQNCLPENYFIYEISPDLRERQKQLLQTTCPHLFSRIHWLDKLSDIKISGIIFANEVMDALPIHCFKIENNKLFERKVTIENNHFCWKLTPPNPEIEKTFSFIHDLPNNYEFEIHLALHSWIKSLAEILNKGVILLFDYGYGQRELYHPDRSQGTLMCYYQHQRHDNPFLHIGSQDITAHINFTQVAENAIDADLSLKGYTTQSAFLLACGLLELANAETLSEVERFKQNQAIKTLTLPSQMGEAIKVIALSKQWDVPLLGFMLQDRTRDL